MLKEMKKPGSPMLLFGNLDLSPIRSILWKGLHLEGPGKPVTYDPECDLRGLMLRQLEQIPYVKDLVKRLRRSRDMRLACGYYCKVPTEAHFSQMKKRIGGEGFRAVEAWLRRQALHLRESQPLSAVGLVQAACIDGTDLPPGAAETLTARAEASEIQKLGSEGERKASSWATSRSSSWISRVPAGPRGSVGEREREEACGTSATSLRENQGSSPQKTLKSELSKANLNGDKAII